MFLAILMLVLCSHALAEAPDHGVFVTCNNDRPSCRLSQMPEAKRFLMESIEKGAYGSKLKVEITTVPQPSLIVYRSDNTQLFTQDVDPYMTYDELHTWIQGLGFAPVGSAAATPGATPVEDGNVTALIQTGLQEVQAALDAAMLPDPRLAKPKPKPVGLKPRVRMLTPGLRPGGAAAGVRGNGTARLRQRTRMLAPGLRRNGTARPAQRARRLAPGVHVVTGGVHVKIAGRLQQRPRKAVPAVLQNQIPPQPAGATGAAVPAGTPAATATAPAATATAPAATATAPAATATAPAATTA